MSLLKTDAPHPKGWVQSIRSWLVSSVLGALILVAILEALFWSSESELSLFSLTSCAIAAGLITLLISDRLDRIEFVSWVISYRLAMILLVLFTILLYGAVYYSVRMMIGEVSLV